MDSRYFPFDDQSCIMKFGSWTEDISRVDLRMVGLGANTTVYWQSVEWDLLGLPATIVNFQRS